MQKKGRKVDPNVTSDLEISNIGNFVEASYRDTVSSVNSEFQWRNVGKQSSGTTRSGSVHPVHFANYSLLNQLLASYASNNRVIQLYTCYRVVAC